MFKKLISLLTLLLFVVIGTNAFARPASNNYKWEINAARGINNFTGQVDTMLPTGFNPKKFDADYRQYDFIDVQVFIYGEKFFTPMITFGGSVIKPIESDTWTDLNNIIIGERRIFRIEGRSSGHLQIIDNGIIRDDVFISR